MEEKHTIAIIVTLFAIAGFFVAYFSIFYADFNFHKVELNIVGANVEETLYFKPDKDYHTIYRNFVSPVEVITDNSTFFKDNSVGVSSVICDAGKAYARVSSSCYGFPQRLIIDCNIYMEPNEYGCTFGTQTGFKKGKEYKIISNLELNPQNIFLIKGSNYIKFIAYSSNNHKLLIIGKNLIVNEGIITQKTYFPGADVILYIPYNGDTSNKEIVSQQGFYFDKGYFKISLIIMISLLPAFFIFILWHWHGKEQTFMDVPSELSNYPRERKAWEVAAYFHPLFSIIDKEFFSALLFDLYRRKIVDLKMIKGDTYVSVLKEDNSLDKIEKKFIKILKGLYTSARDKYKEGNYVSFKAANSIFTKAEIRPDLINLQNLVKKESKIYINDKGKFIAFAFFGLVILSSLISQPFLIFFNILAAGIFTYIYMRSALFIRFKENYYQEYQQWQAFRKYLSHSYSIKNMPHKAVAMWDKYLVYGCALGQSKAVLRELKNAGIINDTRYELYNRGIIISSTSFSSAAGTSGGGVGGGGVGGGGGGGR